VEWLKVKALLKAPLPKKKKKKKKERKKSILFNPTEGYILIKPS
jgi:hypothetical protein